MNFDMVYKALVRQTRLNQILFAGAAYLVYRVFKLAGKSIRQQERINELTREVNTMKREKESNECNA